jgi:chaperonin GroES
MKKIAVYGDRILIKEDESRIPITKSGVIIPDSIDLRQSTGLQKHLVTGEVLGSGIDCSYVNKGDIVMFGRGDLAKIEFEGTHYRILLIAEPRREKTESGIFIPDNAVYEPTVGVVIKVGSSCKCTKEGDKILFGKNAGMPLTLKDKEYVIIRESDTIGGFN